MQTATDTLAIQDQPEAPWGWSREFRMPLYKPGTRVRHAGNWETVSYVSLRRHDLSVHLVGHAEAVDPLELELEPTLFTTMRVSGPYLR